jgi:signal transduction histidine kinase
MPTDALPPPPDRRRGRPPETVGGGPTTTRRTLADVSLGVLLAIVLAGTALALAASWGGVYWVLDLATGLVTGALALRRHRHPTFSAVAASVVALAAVVVARLAHLPHEPGPATVLALAVLVGSAVRRLDLLSTGAGFVVAGVAYGLGFNVISVLAALGWIGAVAAGLGLRLRDAQRRAAVDEIRRDERLDLARELHDLAAHHLTGLVLQAQAARIVARKDAAALDSSLADIETAGSDALNAMRRVVGLLRDGSDAAPLAPGPSSIAEMIDNFAARPGAPAVSSTIDDLPPSVAGTVHRIVQEALTNVVQHAPLARTVTVSARVDDDTATVIVADNGPARPSASPGFSSAGGSSPPGGVGLPGGYGLVGMAERVTALGGEVTAGPQPGGGWQVYARLPLSTRVSP